MTVDSARKATLPLQIVTALLALTFVATGAGKLLGVPPSPANFARWGFSPAFMMAIGAIEVLGGIALLVPRASSLAAILLGGTMLGAIKTGVVHREALHVALPLVLVVLLAIVAYGRREPILRLLGRSPG